MKNLGISVACSLIFSFTASADFVAVGTLLTDRTTLAVGSVARINEMTGSSQLIGPTFPSGTGNINSLTRDPISGIFYTAGYQGNGVTGLSTLYSLDIATGTLRSITPLSMLLPSVQALAVSPDGSFLYAAVNGDDTLYTIDTATGKVSSIGHMGSNFKFVSGLAFNANGALYGYTSYSFPEQPGVPPPSIASLFRVDTSTANTTVLSPAPLLYPAEDIAFDPNGNLWSIAGSHLQQLDPSTGMPIGSYLATPNLAVVSYSGIAFLPEATVPEPGPMLLVTCGLTALLLLRRRVHAVSSLGLGTSV